MQSKSLRIKRIYTRMASWWKSDNSKICSHHKEHHVDTNPNKSCHSPQCKDHRQGGAHYRQCRHCQHTAFQVILRYQVIGLEMPSIIIEKDETINEFFDILSVFYSSFSLLCSRDVRNVNRKNADISDTVSSLTQEQLCVLTSHCVTCTPTSVDPSVLYAYVALYIFVFSVGFQCLKKNEMCKLKYIAYNSGSTSSMNDQRKHANRATVWMALLCLLSYNNLMIEDYINEKSETMEFTDIIKEKTAAKLYKLLQKTLESEKGSLKHLVCSFNNNEYQKQAVVYPIYGASNSLNNTVSNIDSTQNSLDGMMERLSTNTPPNRTEIMAFELFRLYSMQNFPQSNAPSMLRMTQAGFYYEGKDDEVVCFACNIRKKDWRFTDDPWLIHREISPNCSFINNESRNNIPVRYPETVMNGITTALANLSTGDLERESVPSGGDIQLDNIPNGGDIQMDNVPTGGDIEVDDVPTGGDIQVDYVPSGSEIQTDSTGAAGSRMSHSAASRPTSIQTGFMQQNQETENTSAFVPSSHRGQPYLQTLEAAGGVHNYSQQCNLPRAKYPQYASKEARLKTYDVWRGMQHPCDMTEAGFFFTKDGDCTRCFHCGIGLKNWDPPDNPWVEHARWSPRCAYLLKLKGQEFIDLVMEVAENANREALPSQQTSQMDFGGGSTAQRQNMANQDTSTYTHTTSQSTSKYTLLPSAQTLQPQQRDKGNVPRFPLQTPDAQRLISEGFTPKVIKVAMDNIIQRHGWQGVTYEAILAELNGDDRVSSRGALDSAGIEKAHCGGWKNYKTCGLYYSTSALYRSVLAKCNTSGVRESFKVSEDKNILEREIKELKELTTCKICFDKTSSILFMPCGHLVTCAHCAPAMKKCPICRTVVKGTIRTNLMENY